MPTGNLGIKLIRTWIPTNKFLSSAKPLVPKLRKEKVPWHPRPDVVRVHQCIDPTTAPRRAWVTSLPCTKAGPNPRNYKQVLSLSKYY